MSNAAHPFLCVRRMKIKLTVQKEVMNGAVLQQAAVIEFTIRNRQCEQCEQSFAQGVWHGLVQVRQRVEHKRTFYYLEQLLLKHNAHSECINIVVFKDGMDFYFQQRQQAARFISFLESHVPITKKHTRKLVSADHSSNVGNYKDNHFVQIVPLCKDDLVVLPKLLARQLSGISQLVLVKNVGSGVHILDPLTNERQEISAERYWRGDEQFNSVMHSRQLTRYIVLSVDPIISVARACAKKRGSDKRPRLADCVVARESDLGSSDTQFTCVSHLGYLLREGDVVLGYDLTKASWTQDEGADSVTKRDLPDLVLVRKYYGSEGARKWALKTLEVEQRQQLNASEEVLAEKDYEEFMQELEGDREMRASVNLYKARQMEARRRESKKSKRGKTAAEDLQDADPAGEDMKDDEDETNEEDDECVRLEELLDDLAVSDSAEVEGDTSLTLVAHGTAAVGIDIEAEDPDL